ncbi:MAG: RNA-binding transcriptional accessory protein, partial [Kiritimatiellae bacterium]|nr:RNA-binding transcriptional accessory protein [Kiritimatiellia bacterium]
MNSEIIVKIQGEVGASAHQITAVEKLLGEGNTVPFIARYRKEMHGNLDEVAIGKIQERLTYYTELEARKETILKSIADQEKLTPELEKKIRECYQKSALEDLYQPYKPKRRTRAQVAKEKGFGPLAESIWSGDEAAALAASEEDLQFARDIIAERVADMANVRGYIRQLFATKSTVKSEVASPKPTEPTKFEQYYEFSEAISTIPSHRYLAIRRGQKEGVLWVKLELDKELALEGIMDLVLKETSGVSPRGVCERQITLASEDAYKRLLAPSCEVDVTVDKKMEADRAAVEVFAENLRHLLLAAPLGEKAVLAIDPGIRTGCKVAMMDSTGKYLGKTVIYPQQNPQEAAKAIAMIVNKYRPEAVAIGNGTAGRETETFVRQTLKKLHDQHPEIPTPMVVSVSESGASVYSASEIARKEFPDLDLTVRGAISIGRRLQDPLAELVKIDPKAIGVGQYQHDVHQPLLGSKLDEVVVS